MRNITNNNTAKRLDKICDSIIIASILTLISSIVTAIGIKIWLSNFTVTQFASEAQRAAYNTGAWTSLIGAIITIILTIVSVSLLIYRIVLRKRIKNVIINPAKMVASTVLFVVSLFPLATVLLIELFRLL